MLIMFFYTFVIKIMMKTSIESSYQELKDLSAKRHHRLVECKQLHHFNRYFNCTVYQISIQCSKIIQLVQICTIDISIIMFNLAHKFLWQHGRNQAHAYFNWSVYRASAMP